MTEAEKEEQVHKALVESEKAWREVIKLWKGFVFKSETFEGHVMVKAEALAKLPDQLVAFTTLVEEAVANAKEKDKIWARLTSELKVTAG